MEPSGDHSCLTVEIPVGKEKKTLETALKKVIVTMVSRFWSFCLFFAAQCCCAVFMILLFGDFWYLSAFYILWLYLDWETPHTGGRRSQWVRNWTVWKYFKDYFPIHVS